MRRVLVLLAVGLLAAVLSGCEANATPFAARAGQTTISASALIDTMNAIADNKVSRCLFAGDSIDGAGNGTYSMTYASTVLTFMIERALIVREVDQLGLSVTPLAAEASTNLLTEALSSSASTCAPGVSDVTAILPASFRSLLNDYESAQAVLAAHLAGTTLTTSGLAGYAAAHPLSTSIACVSEIVVSSKSTAATVAAQVRAGVSFSALAKAESLDTSTSGNGGSLGCGPPSDFPSEYQPAILSLATHAVSAPIALESPYYGILTVTSRSPGDTLDAALGAISAGSASLDLLFSRLASSGVSVDPSYGHWGLHDDSYSVVPPSGPPTHDVSNLTALSPPTTTTTTTPSSS